MMIFTTCNRHSQLLLARKITDVWQSPKFKRLQSFFFVRSSCRERASTKFQRLKTFDDVLDEGNPTARCGVGAVTYQITEPLSAHPLVFDASIERIRETLSPDTNRPLSSPLPFPRHVLRELLSITSSGMTKAGL